MAAVVAGDLSDTCCPVVRITGIIRARARACVWMYESMSVYSVSMCVLCAYTCKCMNVYGVFVYSARVCARA